MIECLQEELVKVRLREAENDALIRDLRARIHELEEDKKTLREITPDNSVAHLQVNMSVKILCMSFITYLLLGRAYSSKT